MSGEHWGPVDDGMRSWDRRLLGVKSVVNSVHDPDNTMQVALTSRELALVAYGLFEVNRQVPEFGRLCHELVGKLVELSDAQAFLPE